MLPPRILLVIYLVCGAVCGRREKRQLFGNPNAPDQILNTCMGWMLGSFLDGISGGGSPLDQTDNLINNDGQRTAPVKNIHQMDIPVAHLSQTTLSKLNPEERRILENLQLLHNQLKYRQSPTPLSKSLDKTPPFTYPSLGRPPMSQPNQFLEKQWRKVESGENRSPRFLHAQSLNPWERPNSPNLPDEKVPNIKNPWQLHDPSSRRSVTNIFGPIMDKPKNRVIIDTGKNFDRLLIHETKGTRGLGVPLADNWKTMGAMWNDGDIHVVNSNRDSLLGANLASKNTGFSIPFKSLFKSSTKPRATPFG